MASACSSTSRTRTNPADAASGAAGTQDAASGAGGGGGTGGSVGGSTGSGGGGTGSGGSGGGDGSAGTGGADNDGAADADGAAGSAPVTRGLLLWLDATTGVTKDSRGFVASWGDRSGDELDAVQLVEAARPKLVDVGGRPALEFDGVDDRLNLPAGFGNWQAGLTVFIVMRPAADACGQVLNFSNGPEVDDVSFHVESGFAFLYEVVDPNLKTTNGVLVQNRTALVGVVHQPAARAEIRVNGLVAISNPTFTLPGSLPRSLNAVGNGEYAECAYSGQISEILLYARDLSPQETSAVESYLQAKWACCTL
jgi:hypothetical protein